MIDRCDHCNMNKLHHLVDGNHVCPAFRLSPDSEFRYFLYSPDGDWEYYHTVEDRDKAADALIDNYLDEVWSEEVVNICAGEITHTCDQTDYRNRPPDDELIDGIDSEGIVWNADWDYICSYGLVPLPDPDRREQGR